MRSTFQVKMVKGTLLAAVLLLWMMMIIGAESRPHGSNAPTVALPPSPKKRQEGPSWTATLQSSPRGKPGGLRPSVEEGSTHPQLSRPSPGPRCISLALETSFQISASALVFVAFCGWGVVLPFWQPEKLQIRGKLWKWLSIYANGLACLASALALVALILWSCDQGFPAIFIFPTILLLHVILVTGLVVVTITFQLDILNQVTDRTAQRMLDLTTPGGVILVAGISGLLIKRIHYLQVEARVEPVDVTAIVVGAAGICLFPAIVIVVAHCMDMHKRMKEERSSRKEKWREAKQQEETLPL
nr:PREDICTED: uncharacterized protein LOC100554649 isoform X2 [Anolis carolinensis]|eukprot:XP_008120591.1 PREDICTED: uncharacterized protein LOC100554649 isoform X2 [Anolis carolinensis]